VNNIFDREYFVSAHGGVDIDNTPGAPRNAQLSLKLKF
jgi:catecholate siderophore receptor